MEQKTYTYTIIYIIAMIIIPFSGIPFDFRRFIVLIGSVIFLAYFWHMHRRKTANIPAVVIKETIYENIPAQDFSDQASDKRNAPQS